jgi:hypothetical protein
VIYAPFFCLHNVARLRFFSSFHNEVMQRETPLVVVM